jgi:protein subunit release factor B
LAKEGGVNCILEGDANTDFFHSVANGRRRKCKIEFLDTRRGRITEQREPVAHIEGFYKSLFGREERGTARLARSIWQDKG